MKRLSTLLLAFILLLGLTACSGDIGNTPQIFNTESQYVQQLQDTTTAEPTKTAITENSTFAVHF